MKFFKNELFGFYESHSNEIKILQMSNVTDMIEVIEDDTIVFPYIHGDLFSEIYGVGSSYSDDRAGNVISMILSGLRHMHANKIIHRDMKPENILVTHDGEIKICDLGLAIVADGYQMALAGTQPYLAPEMLLKCGYSEKVDIWVSKISITLL